MRATNDEGTGSWSLSGSAITTTGGATRSVAENSLANTNVGAAVTVTSNPNNYTFSHMMTGTDEDKFIINSISGQITVGTGTRLDYETKTSYSVIVTVNIAQAGAQAQSFTLEPNHPGSYVVPVTINVTDVNEPPAQPGAPTVVANSATPQDQAGRVVDGARR